MSDLKILIVDPQIERARSTAEVLADLDHPIEVCTSGDEALRALDDDAVGLIISIFETDIRDSTALLDVAGRKFPPVGVLLVAGEGSIEAAVDAMARGALGFLTQPVNPVELKASAKRGIERAILERENIGLKRQVSNRYRFEHIIGRSREMERVLDVVREASQTTANVLIIGETGTGKELVAKAIHENATRRHKPFVALNCAALSESIIESELFGHEKGSFTGALTTRKGRFEYADGGTLFLDEVGDMPVSTQIKLLRVLEEREIMRVGSNVPIKVDVRLIAATNRDLEEAVKAGTFRRDLYFRLKVVTIRLPALRERVGDIPLLIESFVEEFSERHGKRIEGVTPEARRFLATYAWPGNVRELKNCIESMVVVARKPVLDMDDVPEQIRTTEQQAPQVASLAGHSLEDVERQLIRETLALTEGNREEAARILGIGERTLYRKIKKYRLKE